MTDEKTDFGGSLKFRIWVTRGCYFVLADRLKRKARFSVGAITLISFYVFIVSIVALLFVSSLSERETQTLSLLSIISSVFIIIITLLENSKNYAIEAEYASRAAHALEALFNRYEAFQKKGEDGDNEAFGKEYAEILREARVGRKLIDYHQFRLSNLDAFSMSWQQGLPTLFLFLMELVLEYWLYASMTLLPLAATAWLLTRIFIF